MFSGVYLFFYFAVRVFDRLRQLKIYCGCLKGYHDKNVLIWGVLVFKSIKFWFRGGNVVRRYFNLRCDGILISGAPGAASFSLALGIGKRQRNIQGIRTPVGERQAGK